MALQPRPSSLQGTTDRVEFNLTKFRQEIVDHGYEVTWSKASLCPNRDPLQDDHHRLNCAFCDENGFLYFDPITDIRMHFTSFGLRQLFMPESRYEPGQVFVTALPEHKLSFWDKIELTHSKARFSEVKEGQGSTVTYQLKYPVVSLTHVFTSDGDSLDVASITVNPNGTIDLPSSYAVGTFLSFTYEYRPVFIVQDLLHHVRDRRQTTLGTDTLTEFPVQAMAKLDFLVRDEGLG